MFMNNFIHILEKIILYFCRTFSFRLQSTPIFTSFSAISSFPWSIAASNKSLYVGTKGKPSFDSWKMELQMVTILRTPTLQSLHKFVIVFSEHSMKIEIFKYSPILENLSVDVLLSSKLYQNPEASFRQILWFLKGFHTKRKINVTKILKIINND